MNWRDRLAELKDTIAYVMAYAPDSFPEEDYLAKHEQMTLDRIFEALRGEFARVAISCGETSEIQQCRHGIEEAYVNYRKGDMRNGLLRIQEVLHILMRL